MKLEEHLKELRREFESTQEGFISISRAHEAHSRLSISGSKPSKKFHKKKVEEIEQAFPKAVELMELLS